MIAFPWYLLAIGIVIVIIGSILAVIMGPRRSGRGFVDPRMSDDDIARDLERAQGSWFPNLMIRIGFLCIVISLVWRMVLMIL